MRAKQRGESIRQPGTRLFDANFLYEIIAIEFWKTRQGKLLLLDRSIDTLQAFFICLIARLAFELNK